MTFPKTLWFRIPATIVFMVTMPIWGIVWLAVMICLMAYESLWSDDDSR